MDGPTSAEDSPTTTRSGSLRRWRTSTGPSSLEPTLAQAYKQRGLLHRDEGRTELAVSDLEQALDLYQRRGDLTRGVEVAQLLDELR